VPDLVIRNGRVLDSDGTLTERDLTIESSRVTVGARHRPLREIDAAGMIVAPGLIDLQINGGWGHDFTSDPTSIGTVAAHLPATGVTAFVPTVVTSSAQRRAEALAAFAAYRPQPGAAVALGLHFEGPMISPERAGAHDPAHIAQIDPAEAAAWSPAGGVVLVTLAPETPGALDLIAALRARGVVVSLGHTACTADQFAAARQAGAAAVTHLFNAMAPFDHRRPGPIGATLADPTVVAGLICDGHHVDPVAVQAAWRALGPERTLLVTDAVGALGLPVGTTRVSLASVPVTVGADGVRNPDGVLAGSNLSMDQAVRNLVAFTGCTTAEAIRSATTVPADVLGLTDRGRLDPGARADVVLLDDDLRVQHTIVGGVTAWKS